MLASSVIRMGAKLGQAGANWTETVSTSWTTLLAWNGWETNSCSNASFQCDILVDWVQLPDWMELLLHEVTGILLCNELDQIFTRTRVRVKSNLI